jgi:beta-lactamase class A
MVLVAPTSAAKLTLWKFDAQANRLDITTDEGVRPTAQLVPNPTRIVIDLPGIRWGQPKATKSIGTKVKAVRVGQFNAQTTRLVVEMVPGYSLDPEKILVRGAASNRWSVTLPAPDRETLPPPGSSSAISNQPIALKITAPPPDTFGGLVPAGRQLSWLEQRLANFRTRYPAFRSSMYFLDMETGNYADFKGEQAFPAASIIKLPVLIAFFQDVDAGKVRLDEILAMRPELIASGSGEMQFLPAWTKFSALHTASQMIVISDNTATNMIIKRLGGPAVLNRRFKSWGLEQTVIRNWLPDLSGTNTIHAKDMVRLLAMLDKGKLLSEKSHKTAMGILQRTKTRTLLPAGLGPGAVIAHKTGDIGFMLGDAGLIQMPTGKHYMAAVLVKTPYDDPAGRDFIRETSRIVYTYFSQPDAATTADAPDQDPVPTGKGG